MTTFKKAQVVMLYTNKSKLILNEVQNKLILADVETTNYNPSGKLTKHLYIVNDDGIKEGDYIITTSNARGSILNRIKTISTVNDIKSIVTYNNQILPIELNKKVIATTDTNLKVQIECPDNIKDCEVYHFTQLPTVSDYFIAYYIEAYNRAKPITDILVEYENDILKIHSNNAIFAKKPKDSWSKEEVYDIINKYLNYLIDPNSNKNLTGKEWLDQNL